MAGLRVRAVPTYLPTNNRAHTLLLDDAGGAYACGSDYWWQLGLGETWKVTKERSAAVFPGESFWHVLELTDG